MVTMSVVKSQVIVYSAHYCAYCVRAKRLLNHKGVDFEEILIDKSRNLRHKMERLSGRVTVPQIFIGERHIGGYDDIVKLNRKGLLDSMLGLTET